MQEKDSDPAPGGAKGGPTSGGECDTDPLMVRATDPNNRAQEYC